MAAPRKRTARKTTTTRSRTPAKSGRSSSSFVAMGIIAGLAIAILFYSIFIRQDANLSKGNTPQYAHTPNQTDVLNPLPSPRPHQESISAPTVTQSQSPAPISPSVTDTPSEPPLSIAEAMAQQSETQPTITPTKPVERPKSAAQTKTPSTKPTPTKQTPPASTMTEDTIGNLIAQNEKSAPSQRLTQAQTQTKSVQSKGAAESKEDADHVGALIKTMPSEAPSTTPNNVNSTATTVIAKQNNTLNAVPKKTITLSPVPTKETPFYLQSTFYKTENEADAMRAQLLLLGYNTANIHKALLNNQTVYRVRIGPYTSSTEFEKAQKNLETAKLKLNPIH